MRGLGLGVLLFVTGCSEHVVGDGGAPDARTSCADAAACDDGLFCNGVERCEGGACTAGPPPCGTICDEASDACSCDVPDADGDGHPALGCGGADCDDMDVDRHPGITEVCDEPNVDEDCDSTTFGMRDGDGDGYADARCCNGASCGDDCDDSQADVHPSLAEVCDGSDNDCDTAVDEGGIPVWPDADGDMFGDEGAAPVVGCPGPTLADNARDCDDTNTSINPGATDACNTVDDNCNGLVDEGGSDDWFPDCDEDMYGDAGASAIAACDTPPTPPASCPSGSWARNAMDCDDTKAFAYPGAPELCDRLDDDCSSGGGVDATEDVDGDSHAAPGAACAGGFPTDDCDDAMPNIHGGAMESCDRIDQDCSAGGGLEASEDEDADGHAAITASCTAGPLPKDDCDDTDAVMFPGAPELCDLLDNDCSSGGGDDVAEDADGDGHLRSGACAGGPLPGDDCDDANAAMYPGAPLLAPLLLGPQNGAPTGSIHAAARDTLRPTFRWIARGDCGVTHDVEVDDSCAVSGFDACGFASPEVEAAAIAGTSYQPATDLAVSSVAPVGRRYFWRARSCSGATCSAWSLVRYVDVGRAPADFNGDGYADVVAGAYGQDRGTADEGNAFVYYGSATGIPTMPGVTLDNANQVDSRFGCSVASAGDVNGDGFADLVVGALLHNAGAADEGGAFIYHGGAAGIPSTPSATLDNPTNNPGGSFGVSVASAGDVNGDGYADVIVGAYTQDAGATDEGNAFVFHGSASGVAVAPSATLDNPANLGFSRFGFSVAPAGDVNGDGYADVVVGAIFQDRGAMDEGNAFVYHGGASGVPSTPSVTLDNPLNQAGGFFGWSVASAGDVNGDGYSDLVIGSMTGDLGAIDEGLAFVYHGGAAGVPIAPSLLLDCPANQTAGNFAGSVASAGDVNGDGYADLVIGAHNYDSGSPDEGAAFLFHGSASGVPRMPSVTLDNPANQPQGNFGRSVASAGDVNGDGYADLVVGADLQDAPAADEGGAFVYHGGAASIASTPSTTLENPADQPFGYFGYRVAAAQPAMGIRSRSSRARSRASGTLGWSG